MAEVLHAIAVRYGQLKHRKVRPADHMKKFTTWTEFMHMTREEMKAKRIPIRLRRYIMFWREKWKQGCARCGNQPADSRWQV